MAEVASRTLPFQRRAERTDHEERQILLHELVKTKAQMTQAYSGFNTVSDPDLLESYVFEINALQARYAYYLRRVKTLDAQVV